MDIHVLLQHVIARGIEGRDIYLDDGDRHLFLSRLSKLLAEIGTEMLGIKAELLRQRNRVKVLADARAVIIPDFSQYLRLLMINSTYLNEYINE